MRVYQRSVSPVLYIEWHWRGKRRQRSLKSETGHPVTDRQLAKDIAEEVAAKLKVDHNLAARASVFGVTGVKTLGDLLTRLHAARGGRWKDKGGPERFRKFWLEAFGADTPLKEITPEMVEAQNGGTKEKPWSAGTLRHYRTYLVAAYSFAETKLKWIGPEHNLSAVEIPVPRGRGTAYTLDEVRRLVKALEQVDPRAGWIGHVAWQSGRRLTAIRTLPKAAVEFADGAAVLTFPAETDKAGRTSEVAIVGRALELTRALMQKPGKYVLGEVPPTKEVCIKHWIRDAEKIAEIAHQPGRGWHAMKRRYATETRGVRGRDKQAGTRESTLEAKYVQDDLGPKVEVAKALEAML